MNQTSKDTQRPQTKLRYETPALRTISSQELMDRLGPAVALYP